MPVTRLITLADAQRYAELVTANRDYLAPWSPLQNDAYYTAAGQRTAISRDLAAYERGGMLPLAILDAGGVAPNVENFQNTTASTPAFAAA